MSAEVEPNPAELPAHGERFLPLLRRATRLNLTRPIIPAVAVGSALALFAIDSLTPGNPGPRELVRMFALPPMDGYSDLSTARSLVWFVPLLFIRAGVVTLFVGVVSGRGLSARSYARVWLVSLGGSASFLLLYLLSAAYFRASANPGLLALILLALFPVYHLIVGVIFSTMTARAAARERIRPLVKDRSVWILVALSTWIWMFWSSRLSAVAGEGFPTAAYFLALAGLLSQSILFTAIVLRAIGGEPVVNLTAHERKAELLDRSVA